MKILVVDDEHLINQYIVQCVLNAGCKSEDVKSAASGQRALRILEETATDLALVDITMPKMDGLALLREIKARYPATSVVMLTCHSEFEYARAAMQSNADNYVLKSELTPESMCRLLAEVEESRKRRELQQMTTQLRKHDYLRKIVAGGSDVYVVTEEGLRKNSILLRDDAFIALCFRNTSRNLETVVQGTGVEFENPLLYTYNDRLEILLLNVRPSGRKWDTFDALFQELDRHLDGLEARMDGRIGYSRVYFRMARLHAAIGEALECLNDKFYGEPGKCDVDYGQRSEKLHQLLMRASVRLEEENLKACGAALEELLAYARSSHPDAQSLQEGMANLCHTAAARYPLAGEQMAQAARDAESFADVRAVAAALTGALAGLRKKLSGAIQQAVDFIDQHYAEDVTLNLAADHVFLNREYLSRQFKKEVGMNFSEYLTLLRLRHARTLLETTNLRISDVALRVGIPNISYFSTVFRREFNCSPSEIRSGREPDRP